MTRHVLVVVDPNEPEPDERRILSDEDERAKLIIGDVVTAEGAEWSVTGFKMELDAEQKGRFVGYSVGRVKHA